jgi:hypothetical protein
VNHSQCCFQGEPTVFAGHDWPAFAEELQVVVLGPPDATPPPSR